MSLVQHRYAMYTIKVHESDADRWRDIRCINEDYAGWCHTFADDSSTQTDHLVEALEIADLLWFHSDRNVRSGVFDETTGELLYDAFNPVDLRALAIERNEPIPSPWPKRWLSPVQRGIEPGT